MTLIVDPPKDPYTRAQEELRQLDKAIARDLARVSKNQRRRGQVVQFLEFGQSLYREQADIEDDDDFSDESLVDRIKSITASVHAVTQKARVLMTVKNLLSEKGATPTRELLPLLEQAGVQIGGVDKINALSVLLSKSGEFESDRKEGWTLARPPEKEGTPTDVDASAGPVPGEVSPTTNA